MLNELPRPLYERRLKLDGMQMLHDWLQMRRNVQLHEHVF
jgi:hypothetical protein